MACAKAIREQQLGTTHPDVASSLNNLAGLYESQARHRDAEPLYLRAIDIFSVILSQNHPNTQTVSENFKKFLQKTIDENRIAELSDNPITQGLLTTLQERSE